MNYVVPRAELPEKPLQFAALIGARFIAAGDRQPIVRENPAHGAVVSHYPHATPEDVAQAIASARDAADRGLWTDMPGAERQGILAHVADLIDKHREQLALIETLEGGRPIGAADGEIETSIGHWRHAAELAHDGAGAQLRPLGVVGIIVSWREPLGAVSRTLPYALAAGNCAVVKPSALTSGATLRLGELLREAGLPAGVVNIVAGRGAETGHAIVESPAVDMLAFAGSPRVGRQIGRSAGETLRRLVVEVQGRAAQIVFADADVTRAAADIVAQLGTPQAPRLLVEQPVAEAFRDALVAQLQAVRCGDPFDPATRIGPMISKVHRDQVADLIENARAEGADVRQAEFSTPALADAGPYLRPTLLADLRPGMTAAEATLSGPVLTLTGFDTLDAALALASGTRGSRFGAVWTADIDRAGVVARRLHAGVVAINGRRPGPAAQRQALAAYTDTIVTAPAAT